MIKQDKKVSIILNCYNGEKYLSETLSSIKNQTYKNYEVIFFDNSSTDNSASIAKEFGEELKYYKSTCLIPLGAARNEALKKAEGDYIAFIDADDLWDEEKIEKQVMVLNGNADVGLVMTGFRTLDMLKNRVVNPKNIKNQKYDFENFVLNYSFALSTFLIRKECLENLVYCFDNRLHYAEEYDFFSRLSLFYKAYYIGETLATRRIHNSMNSIKLAEKIPEEHQIVLNNFRECVPDFDINYPKLVKKISYLRDYMDCKIHYANYENKKAKTKMRPYISTEKRALAYFLIFSLPKKMTIFIFSRIYKNHI